jgi:rhodanese-related sulfurtransferase
MKRALAATAALVALAALAGGLAGYGAARFSQPGTAELIARFYDTELAVHASPHSIRKAIAANATDFILVDLRSSQEYAREHIRGAANIPAYRDPDRPAYYDVDRIVGAFRALPKNKDIIVYCYSTPCMTGRKIGKLLADHGIFVKHLGIGWNEWRYQWTSWNHEHEWNTTRAEDYIVGGPEAA